MILFFAVNGMCKHKIIINNQFKGITEKQILIITSKEFSDKNNGHYSKILVYIIRI